MKAILLSNHPKTGSTLVSFVFTFPLLVIMFLFFVELIVLFVQQVALEVRAQFTARALALSSGQTGFSRDGTDISISMRSLDNALLQNSLRQKKEVHVIEVTLQKRSRSLLAWLLRQGSPFHLRAFAQELKVEFKNNV